MRTGELAVLARNAKHKRDGDPEVRIARLLNHVDVLQQSYDRVRTRVRELEDRLSRYEPVKKTVDVRPGA